MTEKGITEDRDNRREDNIKRRYNREKDNKGREIKGCSNCSGRTRSLEYVDR
jgi:hypothetical protein